MSRTSEIARLRAEHAALVTLSRFLTKLVAAPHPPRATELAAVRGMLRDTLIRHLKCEDWALYPRLQAKGDPDLIALAETFVHEMGHLAADFAAYDARWTAEGIEARWSDFCAETTDMLSALAMRIEREDRDLYPAAERLAAAESSFAGRARRPAWPRAPVESADTGFAGA
ncbi:MULTISPECIES: hemerythrin domain-containing protein [unclassified Sphingopyxis]|uniref:hemerythrin domain-containing protein n=1 Tax=Sphingopyxis sp. DBS4 TaxID=2968500 RepID=UPI00214CDD61|nr:hemerythrin domain-containing protein [Sphingopyxis sp. DBS4]